MVRWHLQRSSDVFFMSSFGLWYEIISIFAYKYKRHFFDIFEYDGMHLETDHFELGDSL